MNGVPNAATPARASQRIVLHAPTGSCVLHLILRFGGSAAARSFLRAVDQKVAVNFAELWTGNGAQRGASKVELSIGFSYRGLQWLGLPGPYLRVFGLLAPAFTQGAPARAAQRLGDTGPSAAERWEVAFAQEDAHALVTIHALDKDARDKCGACVERLAEANRVDVLAALDGEQLRPPRGRTGQWVHFGLRDGLTSHRLRGITDRPRQGHDEGPCFHEVHEPGEFLLGHPNDGGYNPFALTTVPSRMRRFFSDASFGVLRKIEQHASLFEDKITEWVNQMRPVPRQPAAEFPDDWWRDYVKAKLCGRWPDGRLLDPLDDRQPSTQAIGAAFDFGHDPQGHGCPFGSHIRRMNPRGGTVHVRQRPLMRRGMPYGSWFSPKENPKTKRGLLGLFFCASLEDQFEHLLGQWGDRNPIGPDDRGDSKDPLIGQHEDPQAVFAIPMAGGGAYELSGFAPFATTRGTTYAFYPSRDALEMIIAADYDATDDEEGDRP